MSDNASETSSINSSSHPALLNISNMWNAICYAGIQSGFRKIVSSMVPYHGAISANDFSKIIKRQNPRDMENCNIISLFNSDV